LFLYIFIYRLFNLLNVSDHFVEPYTKEVKFLTRRPKNRRVKTMTRAHEVPINQIQNDET